MCAVCDDAHYLVDRSDKSNPKLVVCQCYEPILAARHSAELLERSHLGRLRTWMRFELWKSRSDAPIKSFLIDFADTLIAGSELQKPWVYLHGPSGSGKTFAAVCVVNRVLDAGHQAQRWQSIDMLREIRRGFDSGESYDIENQFRRAPLLVLDDLGTENSSDWATSTLFAILNERHEQQMPTIITSNLHPGEFPARLATRLSGPGVVDIEMKQRS